MSAEADTHETVHPKYVTGGDITNREVLVLTPLAIAVVVLGIFPSYLTRAVQQPLEQIRHGSIARAVDPHAAPLAAVPVARVEVRK
jgi:NADH:ubiquinone oxidoreductase subunit 4 (subunit M)